jgi:hypothetical protein
MFCAKFTGVIQSVPHCGLIEAHNRVIVRSDEVQELTGRTGYEKGAKPMQATASWLRRLVVIGATLLGAAGISVLVAPAASADYSGTYETKEACQRSGVANVAAINMARGPGSAPLGVWFECERLGAPAGYDWKLTVHA